MAFLEALEGLEMRLAAGSLAARSAIIKKQQMTAKPIGRDAPAIAAGELSDLQDPISGLNEPASEEQSIAPVVRSRLKDVEDNRTFNPAVRSLRSSRRWKSSLVVVPFNSKKNKNRTNTSTMSKAKIEAGISVASPAHVITCVRRKIRRSAIMKFGHGGGSHRKPRRNEMSEIWCK